MDINFIDLISQFGLTGVLIVVIYLWQKDWKRHEDQLIAIIKENQEMRKIENEIRTRHTEVLTKLSTVIERCNRNGN